MQESLLHPALSLFSDIPRINFVSDVDVESEGSYVLNTTSPPSLPSSLVLLPFYRIHIILQVIVTGFLIDNFCWDLPGHVPLSLDSNSSSGCVPMPSVVYKPGDGSVGVYDISSKSTSGLSLVPESTPLLCSVGSQVHLKIVNTSCKF